jgi:putative phosphoribosyl transferase
MQNSSNPEIYFENRKDAAGKLIETLPLDLLRSNETVVIGVSEGGVYFADQIAKATGAKMDLLLTEPIMAPNNNELAIAMVSETEDLVMHKALIDSFGISDDYVYAEAERKYEEEVLSYVYRYRKGKELASLKGKYVVLTDECIETGLTMMVALKSVIGEEAKNIYIATPILDTAVYQNLLSVCDGVFCPYKIQDYISIEYYYKEFGPLAYEDVMEIVEQQNIKAHEV